MFKALLETVKTILLLSLAILLFGGFVGAILLVALIRFATGERK